MNDNNPDVNTSTGTQSNGAYRGEWASLGYFGRLNYDFDGRYLFEFNIRRDGSSRFHPDHRWGTFWSVGASWKIMQEEFMKDTSDWLSNLSLRASYGAQGNDQVGYYAYQALYSIRNNLR